LSKTKPTEWKPSTFVPTKEILWLIAITGVVWLFALVAWSYVTSVASQVYKGALYLYAAEGIVAEPYDREMLDMAWKFKKS
jgi:hypothetical protein